MDFRKIFFSCLDAFSFDIDSKFLWLSFGFNYLDIKHVVLVLVLVNKNNSEVADTQVFL